LPKIPTSENQFSIREIGMHSEAQLAKFQSNAADVRRIAEGIYDQKERRIVLRFVADSMKYSKNAS